MVRTAQFDDQSFIMAASELIAMGGPTAATMTAIARHAGAPTGSIYHRFTSRSALLGAVWCHALTSMADEIQLPLSQGKVEETIKALISWAEHNPSLAGVIMLCHENDLIDGDLPTPLHNQLNSTHKKLGSALTTLLKKNDKALSPANMALINFALFDGPIAALKPLLRSRNDTLSFDKCRKVALASGMAAFNLLEQI